MKSNRGTRLRAIVAGVCLLVFSGSARAEDCKGQSSWVTKPSLPDFASEPTTPCSFHQGSWMTFLYLTQPVEKEVLRFQTYESLSQLFPAAPTAAASACAQKNPKRQVFLPRVGKSNDDRVPSIDQAGSLGVLVDQDKNVTLYQQYFDPIFSSFVKVCDLTTRGCETADPTLRAPLGSLLLKASWRAIKRDDPNYARFFTLKDRSYDDPQSGKCVTTDVAMVGFHLVYAPAGHPELVWATFEHAANAPEGRCTGGTTTPPTGFSSWLYNDPKSTDCSKINDWPYDADHPSPVPYLKTQTVRNWPSGVNPEDSASAENLDDIKQLNASISGLLPSGSVWKNYFLVGSVWSKGGALPADPAKLAGSTLLANATMETFVQATNPLDANGPGSCFSCHNTTAINIDAPPPTSVNPQPVHVVHALTNGTAGKCSWTQQTMPAACKATQPKAITKTTAAAQSSAIKPIASH